MVGTAKVLKPALLLNAKCHSILGRERRRRGVMDTILVFCFDGVERMAIFPARRNALV
jgi:hypothetical protein